MVLKVRPFRTSTYQYFHRVPLSMFLIAIYFKFSLRSMAVLSRATEWRSRKNARTSGEAAPPQSPRSFSALAHLYYFRAQPKPPCYAAGYFKWVKFWPALRCCFLVTYQSLWLLLLCRSLITVLHFLMLCSPLLHGFYSSVFPCLRLFLSISFLLTNPFARLSFAFHSLAFSTRFISRMFDELTVAFINHFSEKQRRDSQIIL